MLSNVTAFVSFYFGLVSYLAKLSKYEVEIGNVFVPEDSNQWSKSGKRQS